MGTAILLQTTQQQMASIRLLLAVLALTVAVFGQDVLPGLNGGIGRGYDLINGATKGPVLLWHYDEGNTWTFPVTSKSYNVPDELWITNSPDFSYTTSNSIMRNLSDFQKQEYSWHSISVGIPGIFSFSMTKEAAIATDMLKDGNSTLYLVNRLFNLYSMESWPMDVLSGQENSPFSRMMNNLPKTRNTPQEKQAYANFINAFGTHFVPQSVYGGQMLYYIAVNNSLYEQYSSSWVYQQVSLSITYSDITFGFTSGSNTSETSINKEFAKNSKIVTQWVGGTDPQANKLDFKEWYATVIANPAMLQPRLVALSDLFTDSTKKALMLDAIKEYLSTPPTSTKKLHSGVGKPLAPFQSQVPGLQSGIGRGYDIVTERIRAPVVLWTYTYGNTWNNPYRNNELETYPDQMYLTNVPSGTVEDEIDLFNAWSTYYKKKTSSFGLDVSLGFGNGASVGASFGRSKSQVDKMMKNNTRNFATETYVMAQFQLDLWPIDALPAPVQNMINRLPSSYDPEKYGQFITAFGTHYITSTQLGGKMNFTTAFDLSIYSQYSAQWVDTQVKLSLQYAKLKAGVNWGSNTTTVSVDKSFQQHSSNFTGIEGGFPDVFSAQGFGPWVATIAQNPGILMDKTTLVPIHTIVQDYNKQQLLLKALRSYVATGTFQ